MKIETFFLIALFLILFCCEHRFTREPTVELNRIAREPTAEQGNLDSGEYKSVSIDNNHSGWKSSIKDSCFLDEAEKKRSFCSSFKSNYFDRSLGEQKFSCERFKDTSEISVYASDAVIDVNVELACPCFRRHYFEAFYGESRKKIKKYKFVALARLKGMQIWDRGSEPRLFTKTEKKFLDVCRFYTCLEGIDIEKMTLVKYSMAHLYYHTNRFEKAASLLREYLFDAESSEFIDYRVLDMYLDTMLHIVFSSRDQQKKKGCSDTLREDLTRFLESSSSTGQFILNDEESTMMLREFSNLLDKKWIHK